MGSGRGCGIRIIRTVFKFSLMHEERKDKGPKVEASALDPVKSKQTTDFEFLSME